MKTCRKCGDTKPLDQFHNDNTKKDGKCHACKTCKLKQNKAYQKSDAGKLAHTAATQRYKVTHSKKRKAHNAVRNGLRDGKLQRGPCEICGDEKAVAHHDDYDHPLVIRWLCEPHHKEWHCANGEALNPD